MNSSPITDWKGAEGYFTFANEPVVIVLLLAAAVACTIYAIYGIVRHENESYRKLKK
jgi:hypothetical protein